jgi:nucleoid-associated protein YgaU
MNPLSIFKLSKLTISAYSDSARRTPVSATNTLEVQYNPETLQRRVESVFQKRQGIATSSAQARFVRSQSEELSVKLVFDGTRVELMGVQLLKKQLTVGQRIQQFLDLCYVVDGDTHEPSYLKLSWNKGVLGEAFDCRLQSVNITYTAFNRDGSPLHAELDAAFVEDLDPQKKASAARTSSPDLTHTRIVRAGDTLPLLCIELYGDARHYLRVAEVNGLDDFRVLEPGTELFFPPFAER